MELQINDLVSAIKKDGIETAKNEAAEIISNAKKEAEAILSNAKAEAEKVKDSSLKEIKTYEESAKISAEQAKRDAVLAFKTEVKAEFEKLLSKEVGKSLDDKLMAKLILAALNGEDANGYVAEVKEVSEGLKAELADELKKGLEIKPAKNVKGGFKLASKDGSGFFDCTDEEITNMLMPFFREITL